MNDEFDAIGLVFGLVLFLMIIVAGFLYIAKTGNNHKFECIEWRSVVSVEPIPMANFWGKEVYFLVKYDDGSFENNYRTSKSIGHKECKDYE